MKGFFCILILLFSSFAFIMNVESAVLPCAFGQIHNPGLDQCVPCFEVCDPGRNMMDKCTRESSCKDFWPKQDYVSPVDITVGVGIGAFVGGIIVGIVIAVIIVSKGPLACIFRLRPTIRALQSNGCSCSSSNSMMKASMASSDVTLSSQDVVVIPSEVKDPSMKYFRPSTNDRGEYTGNDHSSHVPYALMSVATKDQGTSATGEDNSINEETQLVGDQQHHDTQLCT